MEIYRNSVTTVRVYLPGPHQGLELVDILRSGEIVNTVSVGNKNAPQVVPSYNSYWAEIAIPQEETQFDAEILLSFDYNTATSPQTFHQIVNVITPLLTLQEVYKLVPAQLVTVDLDGKVRDLEKIVRKIIEAYTHQTFGYFDGKVELRGRGGNSINFKMPLVALRSINGVNSNHYTASKWKVYAPPNGVILNVKQAPPDEYDTFVTHGPITVPSSYFKFQDGAVYTVDGTWGYYSVPEDVQEAAKLLIQDYGCSENKYRDNYIDLVKAQDWTLQFNSGAFRGTGNARADQLLDKYVISSLAVV